MRVVVKEASKQFGEIREVENTLEAFQGIVGGYIELFPLTDEILIVLNEEGKLMDLEPNFGIPTHNGYIEAIVGDVAFVSHNDDGDFVGLSGEHIGYLKSIEMIEA